MTIRHLNIFVTVAECGSMSGAARQLYLSQPTVSQAIRELEQHYHTLLFERLGKRLYLTEAGEALLATAHHLVDQFEQLEKMMENRNQSQVLRIGSSLTVGTCLMPEILEKLEEHIPELESYSYVNNTREIEKKLLRSQLDVAVVEGEVQSPDLMVLPLVEDCLVLFCGKNHPFYRKEEVRMEDMEGMRFAMREEGSGTRKLFEQYLQKKKIRIQVAWEANSPGTIRNAVIQNKLLAVQSLRLLEKESEGDRIRVFYEGTGAWNRSFKLVYHKDKFLTSPIYELERILHTYKRMEIPEKAVRLL